jgi:hypothetical protein
VHWNSEVFTALTVAVGLTAVAVRRLARGGWVAVVLGVVNTPAALLGLALVAGKRMLERRRVRFGLVVVAAAALVGTENGLRNGNPLDAGYGDDTSYRTLMPYSGGHGFDYPFFLGLLSLTLSFGKGLLFFAPGLILPVRRRLRAVALADDTTLYRLYGWWLLFLTGLVLVYSPWFAWYGGFTWGPRFLLFAAVPAALELAAALDGPAVRVRLAALAVLALSVWVGLCAAVFPQAAYPTACSMDNFANEALCHYTPDYSVLWYPLVAHLPVSPTGWLVVAYFAVVLGWLAAPPVRALAADLAGPARRALSAARAGWRF